VAAVGLFDAVADALEAQSPLDGLAARGTLRLALKSAGLDPKGVTPEQMRVVLERVLPGELETRSARRGSGGELRARLLRPPPCRAGPGRTP